MKTTMRLLTISGLYSRYLKKKDLHMKEKKH
jgi:hypothetical protein